MKNYIKYDIKVYNDIVKDVGQLEEYILLLNMQSMI